MSTLLQCMAASLGITVDQLVGTDTIKANVATLQGQVATLTGNLASETDARLAAETGFRSEFAADEATLESLSAALAALTAQESADISLLQGQITANQAALLARIVELEAGLSGAQGDITTLYANYTYLLNLITNPPSNIRAANVTLAGWSNSLSGYVGLSYGRQTDGLVRIAGMASATGGSATSGVLFTLDSTFCPIGKILVAAPTLSGGLAYVNIHPDGTVNCTGLDITGTSFQDIVFGAA